MQVLPTQSVVVTSFALQAAEALLAQETLSCEEVEKLWGPPPHGPKNVVEQVEFESEVTSWQGPPEAAA